jgi:PAS domain S-box-containing protein
LIIHLNVAPGQSQITLLYSPLDPNRSGKRMRVLAMINAITWAELTDPEDLGVDVANFNRVLAGELNGYAIDKRWVRKDGRIIDSTIVVRAVRRADRTVEYFVALLQDLTQRRRWEAATRQA